MPQYNLADLASSPVGRGYPLGQYNLTYLSGGNKSCYVGWDAIGLCENGHCNTHTGSCVCNPGFIGMTDLVPMDHTQWNIINGTAEPYIMSCTANINWIRGLYTLPVFSAFFKIRLNTRAVIIQRQVFSKMKKKNKGSWFGSPPLRQLFGTFFVMILGIA